MISWIYIFVISLVVGMAVNRALSKVMPVPSFAENGHFGVTGLCVTGLVTLTVYAEFFSIFYKVGAVCHVIMLLAACALGYFFRKELVEICRMSTAKLTADRVLLFAGIILLAAFFTANGTFHYDTGIYHAQAIRMLEEYGVLKGLGNLQLHYAYNSSYLPLCALFTLSFLLPFPLHTMTGFFMVLFTCYAADGLFKFRDHRRHGGDLARIAVIIYALTNMTGLQSPATDYGTMFMTLYVLCEWITYAEEREDKNEDIAFYGYLSVLAIFTVSMKLSAALLVVLAILPAVLLIREKKYKEFAMFLLVGFISFLPYMIRNVILSGWLFYPVSSIDLFNVVWKIPAEYMKVDADQIKVWGRCLYDVNRVDEGLASWLPGWWSEKQHYEVMLIYSQFVGAVLALFGLFVRIKEKKVNPAVVLFYITLFANMAMWFFNAPFIRYGLAFLLMLPLCSFGDALEHITSKKKVVSLIIGFVASLIVINFCSWIDNYFMDDLVFIKHNVRASHYVIPVDFDKGNMYEMDMDGLTVYVADIDEVNSYYCSPGSCYDFMVERTELIGDSIKDGFRPR
ncbi:MAG: hypothetical protein E7305_11140 [Butyrivibrio sp.]|nr:hypothetical protein [Butyrivibrio sp.]